MGFGRSGTSLMGGILHLSGYYMGDNLYSPRESNPQGFFENDFINGINERILSKYDFISRSQDYPLYSKPHSPYNPSYGQRWLSYLPEDISVDCDDPAIMNDIRHAVSFPCYAYKDPRFNYTFPVWNKVIRENIIFICMFRRPDFVIESLIKECNSVDYLSDFFIDSQTAFELWYNSYSHLLNHIGLYKSDRFVFVHYEQLINKSIRSLLENRLGLKLDFSLVIPELNRCNSTSLIPDKVLKLYETLCNLAQFH